MIIKGIKIQNFLSFSHDSEYIDDCSNVNIFIGKNNAGKPTILSAIHAAFDPQYLNKFDKNKLHNKNQREKPQTISLKHSL